MSGMLHPFVAGIRIIFSVHALEATTERLFPESKHRSKRIRKKLIKRFGGEFRMQPCIFQTPAGIVAHPSFRARIEAATLPATSGAKS
jgi:hypothetical protein